MLKTNEPAEIFPIISIVLGFDLFWGKEVIFFRISMFCKWKNNRKSLKSEQSGILTVRVTQAKVCLCITFSQGDTWEDVYLASAAKRQLLKI